ncbi:MAG: MATE family efflux transporter [Clostridia bacterium]|nr:MATE family efflux transporter [Clostridia bacterium]
MIESFLMSMVNIFDTIMVSGQGIDAVAAVGLTTQPRMIFYAVFFALSIAVTTVVSRRKGQEDQVGANETLNQSLGLVALLAIVLCGTAVIVAEPLLTFAGANEETLEYALTYFRITMIGLMFTSFGMIINAAHRASGNTKISMTTNIVANVTNITFNALLINGVVINGTMLVPELGVKGAAIATLIGNIASFSMSFYSILKKGRYLKFCFRGMLKWKASLLKTLGNVALGAGTEQLFMRIGFFIYAKLVADLGTAEYGTHIIAMNIITVSFACGDGLSVAASALIGQNLGKKRPDLATLYAKAGQRIGILLSAVLILLMIFAGGWMVKLFADPTDQYYDYVIKNGRILTFYIALCAPGQISQVIYNGALRGAGDTKFVAFTSAISIGLIRPLTAYIFCYPVGLGLFGAWISLLIDQYMRLAFSMYRFMSGVWQKIKV